MKKLKGFTLIELMVVVAIIGILASVAVPQYATYIQRSELVDAYSMGMNFRDKVTKYYLENYSFPKDNQQLNVPTSDKLIGNRITGVVIENGAIHIHLGNKANPIFDGKVLTYRPAVVDGSPTSPISWLCGYDQPVKGMSAIGDNKTTVPKEILTGACLKKE